MKIIVAIKQVPDRDAPVRIAAGGKWIEESDLQWAMNEPDAYALEEALQLKEKPGAGEVIVLSAGPERVGSTIREALAKGADRAIHVVCDDLGRTRCPGRGPAAGRGHQARKSRPRAHRICSPKTSAGARPASFSPSCSACRTQR